MKITARLALNQIKRNHHRTCGTVLAIVISTALLTATSCFVSSGNRMLQNFLGENYGTYGSAYKVLLFVPAMILGLLIFLMSVTVISNAFRTSADQRIKEFGILKCVGGTTGQIRETVIYESIWLSVIGIPMGLLLGALLGNLSVTTAGVYVDKLNRLQQSIIMRPISISLKFAVTPVTFVFATFFSFITVFCSAYWPAKRVGERTALECVRGTKDNKMEEVRIDKGSIVGKILGFEGLLANRNMCRNKRNYKPAIRALAIGIMLILSTVSLVSQAKGIEDFMDSGTDEIMIDYCSNHSRVEDEISGIALDIYDKPINNALAEEVTSELRKYDDTLEIIGVGADNGTSYVILDGDCLSDDMKEVMEPAESDQYILRVEVVCVDHLHYEQLCHTAGVPVGSNILLNYYTYNDNGRMKEVVPFNELAEVNLRKADGDIIPLEIQGVLRKDEVLPEMNGLNNYPLRILVPDCEVRFYDWYASPKDEAEYIVYARSITDRFFPNVTDDPYAEEGFAVRISRTDVMIKVLNIAIIIAEVIVYGFVILLLLIGIAGVISTLSTNIMARKREFAVLMSVGMTSAELNKMLLAESILCTLKAIFVGVPLGIGIPWLINLSLRKIFPVVYTIPGGMILLSVVLIFTLVTCITFRTIGRLKKQNLIETIRMETV